MFRRQLFKTTIPARTLVFTTERNHALFKNKRSILNWISTLWIITLVGSGGDSVLAGTNPTRLRFTGSVERIHTLGHPQIDFTSFGGVSVGQEVVGSFNLPYDSPPSDPGCGLDGARWVGTQGTNIAVQFKDPQVEDAMVISRVVPSEVAVCNRPEGQIDSFVIASNATLYRFPSLDDDFAMIILSMQDLDGVAIDSPLPTVFDLSQFEVVSFVAQVLTFVPEIGSVVHVNFTLQLNDLILSDTAGCGDGSSSNSAQCPCLTEVLEIISYRCSSSGICAVLEKTFCEGQCTSGCWWDPPAAVGYEFQTLDGALFTQILDFPIGFADLFSVWVNDVALGQYGPGDSVDFTSYPGGGVTAFAITGINALTESTAFPIQLAFNTASSPTFQMIALAPEPSDEIDVTIDIKPGSYPNSINLGSGGKVPVAILSSTDFDATTVDPVSVTLAGAGVALKGKGTTMSSIQDVDGDGLLDLVVHVITETLALTEGDTEAVLEGETFDGTPIQGIDSIRVVP